MSFFFAAPPSQGHLAAVMEQILQSSVPLDPQLIYPFLGSNPDPLIVSHLCTKGFNDLYWMYDSNGVLLSTYITEEDVRADEEIYQSRGISVVTYNRPKSVVDFQKYIHEVVEDMSPQTSGRGHESDGSDVSEPFEEGNVDVIDDIEMEE